MRFGYFDNQNLEYVITSPNTPFPWINYLGDSKYCALISNTAGGYSFFVDPKEQRILRYRYDNIPLDSNGRYIYIRDDEKEAFFSPTWQPVRSDIENYECRHGLGYTKISSESLDLAADITYFVPLNENLEIWKVKIKNLKKAKRRLTIFSFVEFCLWDAVDDMTNFQRTLSISNAYPEGSTIFHTSLYRSWKNILAFFHTSEKVHSFDCERDAFLGNHGYSSLSSPLAVNRGNCSNSIAKGWAPIGSHCIKISLDPKTEKEIIFVLGVAKNKNEARLKAKKYTDKKIIQKNLSDLKEYWNELLSKINVKTQDNDLDTMVNTWNQYQCMQTFNWSRYASYFEAGISRGMGFRDSNQDTIGFVHMIPQKARERILDLAAIQFEDGSTYHQYSPITKEGALYNYSDDPLWMVVSVASYIKETGDFSILDEKAPFAVKELTVPKQMGHHSYLQIFESKKKKTHRVATIYEHLKRGILYVARNHGPHGLPKMLFADWNDCLNLLGPKNNAESVFVAEFLVFVCKEMQALLSHWNIPKKKKDQEKKILTRIEKTMTKNINKYAWDDKWYRRAYSDSGKVVGSKKSKYAKIFLETQPWAVISGVADKKRSKKCMDSVFKYLATKFGIMLLYPPFREYQPELGEISTYLPGLKENASIFCHPNPWAMIAECMLGRGDLAYSYYRAILPSAQNSIADLRKVEPYVYCQMIAGKQHKDFGQGKNSWLTGSAAWNFVAITQYILGVRPAYDGLLIDPCLPKDLKKCEIFRNFRGDRYNIIISKARKKGVKSIKVDGKLIVGNVIKPFEDGKEHSVEVEMG